ncbi:MAG: DUF6088 family protein [Gammaproteobacteria bacterium]
MKVKPENTIKSKMQKKLDALTSNVILRKDFIDLGDQRQISRGLKQLVKDNKLVKIGYGIYAKSKISKYTNRVVIANGSDFAFREALDRLNVKWEPNWAEKENVSGRSTQLCAAIMVRLKSRFRRSIYTSNSKLLYENNINAR